MELTTDRFPGRIAIMGGGTWATALAKLILANRDETHVGIF